MGRKRIVVSYYIIYHMDDNLKENLCIMYTVISGHTILKILCTISITLYIYI